MKRVLVTGGAGFIGSHLVKALVDRGDEVSIVDNFDPFYPERLKRRGLHPKARLFEADIRDGAAVERAFSEASAVLLPNPLAVFPGGVWGARTA